MSAARSQGLHEIYVINTHTTANNTLGDLNEYMFINIHDMFMIINE